MQMRVVEWVLIQAAPLVLARTAEREPKVLSDSSAFKA
jgi:hypothetical protein